MKRLLSIYLIISLSLSLLGCTSNSLKVERLQSKNYGERIKFLVMHFTAIDYQESVDALVDKGGLSAHYLIPERNDPSYLAKKLKVIQLVDESDRAWHAGSSHWQGRIDVNDQSIGIEIVNVPECMRDEASFMLEKRENAINKLCLFPDYDPRQIELLVELSKNILARNPDISPTNVIGHSDLTPDRRNDPGPRFPWYHLYKNGIGAWYDNSSLQKYWLLFNQQLPSVALVQTALKHYGYGISDTGILDASTIDTLSAFQMHFLPQNVHGRLDSQTAAAVFALLEKYFPEKLTDVFERYQVQLSQLKLTDHPHVVKHGQIDQQFPQTQRSTRLWVNDRAAFKGYKGKGELILDNVDAQSADIYINGQKFAIDNTLQPFRRYQYPLSKQIKTGINTLRVANVKPEGSSINIAIPFPILTDNLQKYQASFKPLDKIIENDIQNGFPGAVLVVVKDGQIIKRSAYGYARIYAEGGKPLSAPVPMTTSHSFDLASNTKMYATNLALMKLVSEGKLDVTQPVSHYIGEYRGGGRDAHLVRDLLTHTAGYAPEVRFFSKDNLLGEQFFSHNRQQTSHLLLTKVPTNNTNRHIPVYSDTDYLLLGLLVERITGMPLDVYVEHDIYYPLGLKTILFNPLQKGMAAAQFAATEIHGNSRDGRIEFDNIRTHVLQGEVHDEKAYYAMQGVAGHAGLFATADDLAVLAQTLLNGGGYGNEQLFANAILEQFIKPEETDNSYGLGWRRAGDGQRKWQFGPYASAKAYGHTGWTGTLTVIDPVHDLAIVLLTNSRHSPILDDELGVEFAGRRFETGKYGSVIAHIYEAVLNQSNN